MSDKTLSKYLRELRKSFGYTQEFVASNLDISRQAYSHYETGRAIPPNDTCYKIAALYSISADIIINLSMQNNVCPHTPPVYTTIDDLNPFLDYIENEAKSKKLKKLSRKEKELIYYFDNLPEIEQNEVLEILKIKLRKTHPFPN
ncbi:MAG: helix-turn-helix domain-containing protein [Lachnospiraceae bacterium]|nr:helix-turn-helix domain-containing protein [Lachnospiraceae bacterium]